MQLSSDPFLWHLNEKTSDFTQMNGISRNEVTDFKNSGNVYIDKMKFCSKIFFRTYFEKLRNST